MLVKEIWESNFRIPGILSNFWCENFDAKLLFITLSIFLILTVYIDENTNKFDIEAIVLLNLLYVFCDCNNSIL